MIAALTASGLSSRAFAKKHGIGSPKVFYWQRRLKGRSDGVKSRPLAKAEPKTVGFVAARLRGETPLATMSSPTEQTLELELPSGSTARVTGTWDAASIALWLSAATEASC